MAFLRFLTLVMFEVHNKLEILEATFGVFGKSLRITVNFPVNFRKNYNLYPIAIITVLYGIIPYLVQET